MCFSVIFVLRCLNTFRLTIAEILRVKIRLRKLAQLNDHLYLTSFVQLSLVVNSLVLTTIIFLLLYLYRQYSQFTLTTVQNPRYSNYPTIFHRAILSLPFYRRTFSFDPPLTDTGTSSARMFCELRFENYVSYFHRETEREREREREEIREERNGLKRDAIRGTANQKEIEKNNGRKKIRNK